MFRWLILSRKLYAVFSCSRQNEEYPWRWRKVTPIFPGTTFAHPILLTQLSWLLLTSKAAHAKEIQRNRKQERMMLWESWAQGRWWILKTRLFFFLNDKNFPSFYWPKNDLIFLLKKKISQSAPHLAWVAPHLRERQPRSMKRVLIISRSSPLEHFVIWTFLRKTEVMSCWEFILQTSTIPQIPSRLLLLGGRSFQSGSSHWISAERKLLQ